MSRTGTPRSLRTPSEVSFAAAYDPPSIEALGRLLDVRTRVVIHKPWFLMSGVGWLTIPLIKFDGYLSEFSPPGTSEGGQPEVTLTITPVIAPEE